MAGRTLISSGSAFEAQARYSRAVRVGDSVFVSGTTAMKDGELVGVGDARAQTVRIMEIITDALEKAGSSAKEVVRYRIFITDVSDWQVVAEEVGRALGDSRPAGTLVVIKELIRPEMLVEIEVDAVIGSAL